MMIVLVASMDIRLALQLGCRVF